MNSLVGRVAEKVAYHNCSDVVCANIVATVLNPVAWGEKTVWTCTKDTVMPRRPAPPDNKVKRRK